MATKKPHYRYIGIAFATVLFWRGAWHTLDRIPFLNGNVLLDIGTGTIGLLMLWSIGKTFKHLD
jgi:hypothetical protein